MILVANDRSNQALSNKLVSNDMGSLFEVPDAQICQKLQSYILAAINDIYICVCVCMCVCMYAPLQINRF